MKFECIYGESVMRELFTKHNIAMDAAKKLDKLTFMMFGNKKWL